MAVHHMILDVEDSDNEPAGACRELTSRVIDVRKALYRALILEQVPAVLPVWEAYAAALPYEGYSMDCGLLRTEEYGVPQTRKRAVLMARLGSGLPIVPSTERACRERLDIKPFSPGRPRPRRLIGSRRS